MPFQLTTATKKVIQLKKRIRAITGGTSAGKTITILQCLIDIALSWPDADVISVVSESLPHLKRGAMRDFMNIMKEHNYWQESNWSVSESTYTFPKVKNNKIGWKIEFFGADSPDKVRGPRRSVLYVNEANNVPYSAFDQLEVRTKSLVYLDWNPISEFWFYSDVLLQRERDVDFITLTYKDNEGLPQSIVESIESRRGNKNWWRVYGEGQLGNSEDKVFSDWRIIDEIPFEAKLQRRFLDFGYTSDPTVIGSIYYYNGGYILHEEAYQKGLSNKQIADMLLNLDEPNTLVKADSAEPKSIDEIKSYGVNIQPAEKGKGSIIYGIQKIQAEKISITKSSINGIKEYRNYMWARDKNGNIIPNTPIGIWNHFMDGSRYGFDGLSEREPVVSVFGRGDSITGHGTVVNPAKTISRGYKRGSGGVRTFL